MSEPNPSYNVDRTVEIEPNPTHTLRQKYGEQYAVDCELFPVAMRATGWSPAYGYDGRFIYWWTHESGRTIEHHVALELFVWLRMLPYDGREKRGVGSV